MTLFQGENDAFNEKEGMHRIRFITLSGIVLAAALSRLLPHPPNVAPIAAMALFGGAYFDDKRLAFAVPLLAMFLSDLIIGFYSSTLFVYGSFALITLIGFSLREKKSVLQIAGATLASSILFFVITNFGVWFAENLYPKTAHGLEACFIAAIPFFRNTLTGDFVYVTVLFGGMELLQQTFPRLAERKSV